MQLQVNKIEKDVAAIESEEIDVDSVAEYHGLALDAERLKKGLREIITNPVHVLPFLQEGRLIQITDDVNGHAWGWGVVISARKDTFREKHQDKTRYVVDTYLLAKAGDELLPGSGSDADVCKSIPVTLPLISAISQVRIRMPSGSKKRKKSHLGQLKRTC